MLVQYLYVHLKLEQNFMLYIIHCDFQDTFPSSSLSIEDKVIFLIDFSLIMTSLTV